MRKCKKVFLTVLLCLTAIFCVGFAVSCDGTPSSSNGGQTSQNPAQSGGGKEEGKPNDDGKPNETEKPTEHKHQPSDPNEHPASCEEGGYRQVVCVECGETLEEEFYNPLGHNIPTKETDVVWSGETATFFLRCDREGCEWSDEVECVAVKSEIPASCDFGGEIVWLAFCKYEEMDLTASKREILDPLGHDYDFNNARFEWEGYSAATLVLTCRNDSQHTKLVPATVTSQTISTTGCERDGVVEYTANASYKERNFQSVQTEVSPSTGHDWDRANPVWTWEEDYSGARVAFSCKHGCGMQQTGTGTIYSFVTPATCESEESTEYQAKVTVDGVQYTDKVSVTTGAALGHDYRDTGRWSFDNDYESGSLELVCNRNGAHTKTVFATVTKTVEEPTCKKEGLATYYAVAVYDGNTYQMQDSQVLQCVPCGYDSDEFEWAFDGDLENVWWVEVTMYCCFAEEGENGEPVRHSIMQRGSGTVSGYYPTCTQGGQMNFALSVEYEGKTYTKNATRTTDPYGHYLWHSNEVVDWKPNEDNTGYSSLSVSLQCLSCNQFVQMSDTDLQILESLEADCENDGYIRYCAEFLVNRGDTFRYETSFELLAKGHTEIEKEGKKPTCIEGGWADYIECAVCDYTTYQALEKSKHRAVGFICEFCEQPYVSEGLTYQRYDQNRYECLYYSGQCEDTRVVIASEYNGCPVFRVSGQADGKLESLSLPSSITECGMRFTQATNLQEIYTESLNDYLKIKFSSEQDTPLRYAQKGLFVGNQFVGEDIAVEGLTAVGDYAFYGVTWLKTLSLGEELQSLGKKAFTGCVNLKEIRYGAKALLGFTENTAPFAGTYEGLKISLLRGVETVPAYAFYGIEGLERVEVTSIGIWYQTTFAHYTSNPASIAGNLYLNGELVKTVDYLTYQTVSDYAFYNVKCLERIIIPSSVSYVGKLAFYGCDSVTEIVYGATASTYSENNSPFLGAGAEGLAFKTADGCKSIPDFLKGNENLSEIVIAKTVESIAVKAFAECVNVSKVYYDAENAELSKLSYQFVFENLGKNVGVELTVGKHTKVLPAFSSGSYVVEESERCFVTSLTFEEDSVCEWISDYAFWYSSISVLQLPSTVKYIGTEAFRGCKLTELVLPESTEIVGSGAFRVMETLVSITINENLKEMHEYAFESLPNLKTVNYNAVDCKYVTNNSIFHSMWTLSGWEGEGVTLTIGKKVKTLAKCAFTSYFVRDQIFRGLNVCELVFEEGSELTSIGDYAFYACSNLQNFEFPEKVKTIGFKAFLGCVNLTKAILPDSIEKVGGLAFSSTSVGIASVGSSLRYVGVSAFGDRCFQVNIDVVAWCTAEIAREETDPILGYSHTADNFWRGKTLLVNWEEVTTLVIPATVTQINDYAFYSASSLETLYFEEREKPISVGAAAFYGCALTAIVLPKEFPDFASSVFGGSSDLRVYYLAGEESWTAELAELAEGNLPLKQAIVYYYSEEEPQKNEDETSYLGKYWHYAEDGVTPEVWVLSETEE